MGNKHSTLKSLFDDIADSIRNKTGSTGDIIADDFPKAIDDIRTSDIQLAEIAITKQPTKTSYTAKETFDTTGMEVKAVFSNEAYKLVTDFNVEPSGALKPTDTKATVKYTEFGVTAEADVTVTVAAIKLTVPAQSGAPVYTGSAITPAWSGYDSSLMSISGETSGINAGSYTAKFSLKDKVNYTWADGTTADKSVAWSIGKAQASITLDKTGVVLNGDKLSETVNISSVGMTSIMAMSSDMTVATVSLNGNVLTISSVDETTGTATIVINGTVDSNYNAPEYPSVEVSAEFTPPATVTLIVANADSYSSYARVIVDGTTYCAGYGDLDYVYMTTGESRQLSLPVGTQIDLLVSGSGGAGSNLYINLNGSKVADILYSYTVTGDATISMESYYNKSVGPSNYQSFGRIYITEFKDITLNTVPNGTLTTSSNGAVGSTVTLTPVPDEGYKYGGATVTYTLDGVEQTITLDANTTTFTMPAADVTVTPVWNEAVAVTITLKNYDQYNYGTITYNGVQQTATFTANIGDTIEIKRIDVAINDPNATPSRTGYQMINESTSYTVVSDAIFEGKSKFSGNTSTGMYYLLSITEIPEGQFSFTIGSSSKNAIEGMTWAEWIPSEYGSAMYEAVGEIVYYYGRSYTIQYNGVNVRPTDEIIPNAAYAFVQVS